MQYWQKIDEFLSELDKSLTQNLEITLIGGAALILEYHHPRVTYDIDVLNSLDARTLCSLLDKDVKLNKKYDLPVHIVDGSFFPMRDNYAEKRREYRKGNFKRLKVYVLDVYDLILSKLDRCDLKDRDDIGWLKDNFSVDTDELLLAYKNGRQYALNADRVDANFIYIMEVVFGVVVEKERLIES